MKKEYKAPISVFSVLSVYTQNVKKNVTLNIFHRVEYVFYQTYGYEYTVQIEWLTNKNIIPQIYTFKIKNILIINKSNLVVQY